MLRKPLPPMMYIGSRIFDDKPTQYLRFEEGALHCTIDSYLVVKHMAPCVYGSTYTRQDP